ILPLLSAPLGERQLRHPLLIRSGLSHVRHVRPLPHAAQIRLAVRHARRGPSRRLIFALAESADRERRGKRKNQEALHGHSLASGLELPAKILCPSGIFTERALQVREPSLASHPSTMT